MAHRRLPASWRRSFALLRPIVDSTSQDHLGDLILDADKAHEAELAACA